MAEDQRKSLKNRKWSFDWTGLSEEECWRRIRESEEQIKRGEYITAEELGVRLGYCRRRNECAATKL